MKHQLWCKDNNEWEKDEWLITPDGKPYDLQRRTCYRPDTHILVTGIEIHNKIYFAGDILKCNLDDMLFEVEPENGNWVANNYRITSNGYKFISSWIELQYIGSIYENIGNKYENPDLLKYEGE